MSEEKKKLDPVIDGSDVVVRKKSKGQQAVESFLGEEVGEVKNHIVQDLVIPSAKDAMSNMCGSIVDFFNDMFHEFIDTIFFGSSETRQTKASQTYVSYQGYYNKSNRNNRTERKSEPVRHSVEELEYPNLEKAVKVRNDLIEQIENYNQASVADLFYLSEKTLDWAEYKEKDAIGWTDISAIGKPRRRRGKYIIPLERPVKLED